MNSLYHHDRRDTSEMGPATPIDGLLLLHPEAARVFVAHRLICVGCPFSQFHTIGDAIRLYQLDLDSFMRELYATIAEHSDDSGK